MDVPNPPNAWTHRGYLPHFDDTGVIQHVGVHLADSLPREALERVEHSLLDLPEGVRKQARQRRLHALIDAGYGACALRHPELAKAVENSLLYFHGKRYDVHAWVVMPNHWHVLFMPYSGWPLKKCVSSWKKFTARAIRDYLRELPSATLKEKALLNVGSPVWHPEFWDRFMRDAQHYENTVAYIQNNPVAAGLIGFAEDWPWSSAYEPKQ